MADRAPFFKQRAQARLRHGVILDAQHMATAQGGRQHGQAGFAGKLRGCGLNREDERRAVAGHALDADASAHELGKPLANREAEAGAAIFARGRGIDLGKGFEEPVHSLGGNADASVAHGEFEDDARGILVQTGLEAERGAFAVGAAHFERDAAGRRKFDRVVDEIDDDLAQARDVADDPRGHVGREMVGKL